MDLRSLITDIDIGRIENNPALYIAPCVENEYSAIDGRLLAYVELVRHRMAFGGDVAARYPMLAAGILPSLGEIVDHLFSRGIGRYSTYRPSLELVRLINNGRRLAA